MLVNIWRNTTINYLEWLNLTGLTNQSDQFDGDVSVFSLDQGEVFIALQFKDVRAKIFQHWFFSETFTT